MSSTSGIQSIREFLQPFEKTQTERLYPSPDFFPEFGGSSAMERSQCAFRYPDLIIEELGCPGSPQPRSPISTKTTTPSLASSTTQLSASIFDRSYAASDESASTAPPPRGQQPQHLQRPMLMPNTERPIWLPCEFAQFSQCPRQFGIQEVDEWIQHIIDDHLNGILPRYCACWFCNATFEAESDVPAEREQCYRNRMHHNAEHFRENGVTAAQRRSDFHFLDHVNFHHLIEPSVFESARRESELPTYRGIHIHTQPTIARSSLSQFHVIVESSRSRRRQATSSAISPPLLRPTRDIVV